MMQHKNKQAQAGFYMLESLLAIMIFFTACLTLIPIQHQLMIEKKLIREEDKATYFLSNKMHEAILGNSNQGTEIFRNVISSPLTLTITYSDTLIEGCVTWDNVKQQKAKKCQYAIPQ
ncbi:type II secretion system protein [Gracilibacillus lacisalsi]|uniref:type II secretion system protein n=1 Tax=Gracilibacillus lacisalsi TaxID=393087 RepID=UPI0012EAAC42|nr:type II secretion system protein [Gracilibacillus lacisalsi]